MTAHNHKRGGAAVSVLSALDPWEADLIMNLRLWCSGPVGQRDVCNSYATALPASEARCELAAFESLLGRLTENAHRPLVRHDIGCSCVGSDEGVFAHIAAMASSGDLAEASLVASLLVKAAHAEHIALLAGQVGTTARRMALTRRKPVKPSARSASVTLH
ncbi:MAG: hypothetical protein AAF729_05645 [Pseudomonadota bacterium]